MKNMTSLIIFALLVIGPFLPFKLAAVLPGGDASPPCYRDMQVSFFSNRDQTAQALSLSGIDQSLWFYIDRDLRAAVGQVPRIVQAQARSFNPNPLERPFNPDGAFKILQSSLFSVYFPVLNRYRYQINTSNINNDTITSSFNYIWLQQQAHLLRCMGVH
jgi:hypothetical protein